jgi:predicted RNase H-like nuclease (RuvC/YqgF family)
VNAAYIELDDAMGLAREREAELEAGLTAEIEEVTSLRQENTELERERAALQTQESNRTDTQWRSIVQGWRNKSAALQQQLTESKEREEQLKMELEQARDAVTTYKYTQSEGRDTV